MKILETEYAVEDYAAAISKKNPELFSQIIEYRHRPAVDLLKYFMIGTFFYPKITTVYF